MPRHYKNAGKFGLETASPVSQIGPVGEAKPAMQLFDPVKVDERLKTPESLLKEYYAFSINMFADKLSSTAIDKTTKHFSKMGELHLDVKSKDYIPNINNYNTGNFPKSLVAGKVQQLMKPGSYFASELVRDENYQNLSKEYGIDMEFWSELEYVVPFGYVPAGEDSGPTFMDGIDLSSCVDKDVCLRRFKQSKMSGDAIATITPYMGLKGNKAREALKKYYRENGKPLQIPWEDSAKMSAGFHKNEKIPFVINAFNNGLKHPDKPTKTIPKRETGDGKFADLPDHWKTAVYAMGGNNIWMKNFVKQLRKFDFKAAKENLENWSTSDDIANDRAAKVLKYVKMKEKINRQYIDGSVGNVATNI